MRRTSTPRAAAALLAVVLVAASSAASGLEREPGDPLESVNRISHRFSLFVDRIVLGPVARGYLRVTPASVRTGITNFIDNITYPNVILNDFLQGKFEQGLTDSMRFVVNTTFGLVGFIDFASGIGFERNDEDFGQTLAVWGLKEVAYLELPVVGPNSVRDVANAPIAWQTSLIALADVSGLVVPVAILAAVNARANANGLLEMRERVALDSYVFTRESYRRRRNHLILDGELSEEDEDLYSAPYSERGRRQEFLLSVLHDPGGAGPGGRRLDAFYR